MLASEVGSTKLIDRKPQNAFSSYCGNHLPSFCFCGKMSILKEGEINDSKVKSRSRFI